MAKIVMDDAYLSINDADLSDHIKSVTLHYEGEMLDDTAMGDTTRSNKAGLLNWSVDIEFVQDYAAGEVDATLFDLVGADAFAIILKPDGDTTSATNPKFTGDAVLESYPPIAGAIGDLATTTITLRAGGTLSRATSDV
jgi:hypothetical protein